MNTTYSADSLPLNSQRNIPAAGDSFAARAAKLLFGTQSQISSLLLRLGLGAVFLPHGAQKVLGWFGGYGFEGTMGFFTGSLHIPAFFAFLAILAEFGGALALIAGFFTRIAALGIASLMVVAVAMVHWQNGFFMNWYGNQKGEGFEYHLLAVVIAVTLVVTGGGKFSVDRAIVQKIS
jgi:putative oxidoreductase